MPRYVYYHVLYVAMINIMMFIPTILIRHHFDGAVSGMLVASMIGTIVMLGVMACFEKFPGLGFPELCDRYLPGWLGHSINLFIAFFLWMPAGLMVIYSYAETVRMFFYPDMNRYLNLLLMATAAVWASSRSTRSVQFIHEIMVLLSSPFIIWFLLKALFNKNISWDAVRYVIGYIDQPPDFMAIAASTFVFSGYLSLTIFNRLNPENFKFRLRFLAPLFVIGFLIVTFIVPIGMHGTVGVEHFVYLWSMTADSIISEYGFINRILFIFLLLFTALSLLFVMNTWHTTIMLIRYAINKCVAVEEDPPPAINLWLAGGIGLTSFAFMFYVNQEKIQWITECWLILRFTMEITAFGLMLYFTRKRKKESACPSEFGVPRSS
ncbi:hypothetical protein [Paenibacillus ferrarius]|uniref:hypothetical protein n=1 Tax=Paenibacillus ferrarius TaxID=1469647 RepID=UPI003D2CC2B1